MIESESKPLEIWIAEDSPFYRLVVEEAIEELAKVAYMPISLTVFERFGDVREAFDQAERGLRALPSAVLSDLHFPDNSHDDLQDILEFYSRFVHSVPVSYMSCNLESLALAESLSGKRSNFMQPARFLRKDTADTVTNLVKTIHYMVFVPRTQCSKRKAALA